MHLYLFIITDLWVGYAVHIIEYFVCIALHFLKLELFYKFIYKFYIFKLKYLFVISCNNI